MLGFLPHVPDEISYVFQGRIFASGRLSNPLPPLPELFQFDHIFMAGGRWASIYPPGWPLLLSAGWLMRAPWIVNPLLFGVSIVGLWLLAEEWFDRRTAWTAIVLFAASPFVLLMHAGFMSHPAALCCAVWCALFIGRSIRGGPPAAAFLAGVFAGGCFLIRPATATALLWPLFVWQLFRMGSARRWLPVLAGLAPFCVAFLVYNRLQFGSWLSAGYRLDPSFRQESPSMQLVLSNAAWYFLSLNRRLWQWPFPNLLVFVPLLPLRRFRGETLVLAACAASLVGLHCFYYWADIVYGGPRFAFEAMAFLAILAARALQEVAAFLPQRLLRLEAAFTWFLVLAGAGYSLSRMPGEAAYHSQMYHARDAGVVRMVDESAGGSALILIGGNPYVYGSFFFENALDPQNGGRVFARDIPGREEEARRNFPRAETWRARIDMEPIAGPNRYPDRWKRTGFSMQRLGVQTTNVKQQER